MANIELIKVLRDRTGAGMMDCKNALDACDNDVDKACDWLREKGIAKQAKKADRIAAEGLALITVCEKCHKVVVSEVNCETDFVAHADPFKELVLKVNDLILKNGLKTLEEANEAASSDFTDATVKLGEKLSLRRFEVVEAEEGQGVGTYIHMGGKIAVITVLEKEDPELAKGLAIHICANSPRYISTSDIDEATLEKERAIQTESAKNDEKLKNKPEAALKNIIEGKVRKVFSEVTLEDQEFLMEPGKTCGQAIKEKNNKLLKFVRFQVGEGLEKRVDNFAEEVMAQAK